MFKQKKKKKRWEKNGTLKRNIYIFANMHGIFAKMQTQIAHNK